MSVIAAALRELMAAGVTGDALVTAIERIEAATLPRRSVGAERQARYRERHKTSQNVTSVTSDEAHSIDSKKENKKKKKVYTSLPLGWSPSDACVSFAQSKGWTSEKVKSETARFCDHALANDRRQADWDAAWRNWVTSPFQKKGNGNGAGNAVMEAFDDLIDRAGGSEIESNSSMRDITPRRS